MPLMTLPVSLFSSPTGAGKSYCKRKPTTIDFPAVQYDADTLAELLTFDLKVDNLNPQKALLERIMRVKFDSPTPFGMDATWDGKPLHCKWMDLSGRIGNRDSFTYPLLECDVSQSNYWEPMNIMVSEVNYENLMDYFKTLEDLWTQAIHSLLIIDPWLIISCARISGRTSALG